MLKLIQLVYNLKKSYGICYLLCLLISVLLVSIDKHKNKRVLIRMERITISKRKLVLHKPFPLHIFGFWIMWTKARKFLSLYVFITRKLQLSVYHIQSEFAIQIAKLLSIFTVTYLTSAAAWIADHTERKCNTEFHIPFNFKPFPKAYVNP